MEGPGGRTEPTAQEQVERDASYLADAFDSPQSLDFFRLVAATVPQRILWDAFTRARDVPRTQLRRTRAAVFVSLIREHVGGRPWRRRRRGPSPSFSRCLPRP